MSRVRTILLGHRSRSRLTFYVCAFQNQVRPITSFESWWDLKIIWQKLSPRQDDMSHGIATSLGQRSMSQTTLTVFCIVILCTAYNFITSGMVGFENNLAQMIIKTRQCVPVQEPCPYVNVQIHSPHLQLCIGVQVTIQLILLKTEVASSNTFFFSHIFYVTILISLILAHKISFDLFLLKYVYEAPCRSFPVLNCREQQN